MVDESREDDQAGSDPTIRRATASARLSGSYLSRTPAPRSISAALMVVALGGPLAMLVMLIPGRVLARLLWDKGHVGELTVQLALTQVALLVVALLGARSESTSIRTRLAWHWGSQSASTIALLVLGTFFVWALGQLFYQLLQADQWLPSPGQEYERLAKAFAESPWPWRLLLIVVASVGPGICEEALFRGYLQNRLLASWSPARAIAVSGTLFACFHVDPNHILGILPVCFWLGYVAYRSGSIMVSMLCHTFVNACGQWFLASEVVTDFTATPWAIYLAGLIGLPAFVLALWRLRPAVR